MIIECNEIQQYYVYRHRRLDTFEVFYIGISKVKSRSRNKSTRNKVWKNIVNKTKYSIEIIQQNLSHEDACELEILLIQEYGRKDLGTGCLANLTDGGEGGLSPSIERRHQLSKQSKERVWSEESRKKLSKSRLNKPLSEYQLSQIRNANAKRKGLKLSEDVKLKMVNSSYLSKKVIDTNTGIIYKSATEVSKIFSINQNTLRTYLIGTRTNKTTFKYLENGGNRM